MLLFLALLSSLAQASSPSPVALSVEVGTLRSTWTIPALQPGDVLDAVVPTGRRRQAEISVVARETTDAAPTLTVQVVEVRTRRSRPARRTVLGTPVVAVPSAPGATRHVGVGVPFARGARAATAAVVVRVTRLPAS